MAILAGEIVSAGRLNRMQPVTYSAIASSTVSGIGTSVVDVPGATVTFSTEAANASYVVHGSFDFIAATPGSNSVFGRLYIDGADIGKIATYRASTANERALIQQTWSGQLAASGSHTFTLRVSGSPAGSAYNVNSTQSGIVVVIYEVV